MLMQRVYLQAQYQHAGWLEENGLYKCEQCSQLVAKSHSNSHLQKCTTRRGLAKTFYASKERPIAFKKERSSPQKQFHHLPVQAMAQG